MIAHLPRWGCAITDEANRIDNVVGESNDPRGRHLADQ